MVSIIIPAFNMQSYLDKCIKSAVNQTFKDLEIIIVNDGSTDETSLIAHKWAKKDARIKVIDKSNGGLSDARNAGVRLSKGDYLFFLDSDDSIGSNVIQMLYDAILKTGKDIANCEVEYVYASGAKKKKAHTNDSIYTREQTLDMLILNKGYPNVNYYPIICAKLYKRKLFDDVEQPVGKLHEDIATSYKIVDKSNGFVHVDFCYYEYLLRSTSIMGNYKNKLKSHKKNYNDLFDIYLEQIHYFESTGRYVYAEHIKVLIKNSLIRWFCTAKNKEDRIFLERKISETSLQIQKKDPLSTRISYFLILKCPSFGRFLLNLLFKIRK